MRDIERRIKRLEQTERLTLMKDMYAVRIPDKDGNWPEKEEDRRLGRHVVLLVRGEDGRNNEFQK